MTSKEFKGKNSPLTRVKTQSLQANEFITKIEITHSEAIARIELNLNELPLIMETALKDIYQKLDIKVRKTEESQIRKELSDRIRMKISDAFGTLREISYDDSEHSERLDLIVGPADAEKRLLSIEIKSDRSSLAELAKDWVKLKNLENGGRKISIFAGYAGDIAYANYENFLTTVADGKHPEYPYLKQIAKESWNTYHVNNRETRKVFMYVWAINSPKTNMTFDIYEVDIDK